jgi:hypothetical protein
MPSKAAGKTSVHELRDRPELETYTSQQFRGGI